MRTDLALDALEQALYDRQTEAGLVHHSDRGSHTGRIGRSGSLSIGGVGGAG